jgi:hypothetical protein
MIVLLENPAQYDFRQIRQGIFPESAQKSWPDTKDTPVIMNRCCTIHLLNYMIYPFGLQLNPTETFRKQAF